jgi:hypothetical protein
LRQSNIAEARAAEVFEMRPRYRDWFEREPSFRPLPEAPDAADAAETAGRAPSAEARLGCPAISIP